ncbi:phospholipid-binding protein [Endozoicomonas montiporae]|uniref:Phospholipid-binding protein n=1 Tax=Endozoicomonas montiporae TaxID=1027273 RepID=A0A081N623_9GAMM|nr:phospholipid-binding protein [Endozoicomonas montiporae]
MLAGLLVLTTGCATVVDSVNEDPIQQDPTERSWGNWLDDQTIETVAEVNINKSSDEFRRNSRIKVISFNGIVLIIGQVPNQSMKDEATRIVTPIQNVRKVYNELTIGPRASVMEHSSDAWLTTKIKTKLIQDEIVSADKIKVNTEKGTVFLMGLATPKEASNAVEAARNTRGVQKVVKIFEYVR